MESGRNKTRHLEFRNYGDTETELKDKIQRVFDNTRKKGEGVFTEDAKNNAYAFSPICLCFFFARCKAV